MENQETDLNDGLRHYPKMFNIYAKLWRIGLAIALTIFFIAVLLYCLFKDLAQ